MSAGRWNRILSTAAAIAVLVPVGDGRAQTLDEAEAALRTGRYEEAIDAFSRLTRREPSSAPAARGLARALYEVGRYARSEEVAREFAGRNPGSAELWNSLGRALYGRGAVDEAEAAFERSLAGGASDALQARLNRAVLWYETGRVTQAMGEFDSFIDVYNRDPSLDSSVLTAVGTAVRYLGTRDSRLYPDALRAYDEAIAADPSNLEPRVRAAELFLEKYNSADAAAEFEDVLQVNPSHPRALLGMGRRLRFDGAPGALEMIERSLETNPNYVEALAFRAELLLEIEDYEGAARQVERALDVNPASLQALSVMAAVRFLQDDTTRFEALRRRIFNLNPRHSDLWVLLAQVSARNRLYRRAVRFGREAVELDPDAWRGHAELGVNLLRIGAIAEGRRHLEIAFEGDPYDVWTKNTLDLLDTFAGYEIARSDRFELMIDDDEAEILGLYLEELADEAYERLSRRYGHRAATPIRVEVFRSHADFSVRTIGLVGMGALGVSFGPVIAMDSPSAREPGAFNWGSTLWHELAHTFHLELSDGRVPRWFSEGLAVYEERRARPGWGGDVTPSFLLAHLEGRLLPVGELNRGFARPSYPEQVIHSYYQASLVCELIEEEAGWDALVRMLHAYRDGLTNEEVFETVLDSDVEDFSDRFFAYLEERFARPLAALAPARVFEGQPSREELKMRAASDPDDFLAQLGYGHLLAEQGRHEEAVAYLERAKASFPQFAGAGSPYHYLAAIYRERGDLERAEAELAALTAINERDLEANLALAEVREARGDLSGAAAALERTVYIYPYEPELHARLAALHEATGDLAGAVRERRAVLALDPVDRVEALYRLARAHYAAGDLASARQAVLMALERAPAYEPAQDLLLEIHSRRDGG